MTPEVPPPGMRVLVVEDGDTDFLLVRMLLLAARHARFEVVRAETADEGLAALLAGSFDVALVDYRLGARTGLDLLREAVRSRCFVPVIMLTAQMGSEIDLEASTIGAADFIPKSELDSGRLERAIRYAVRHARALEEVRKSQKQLENFVRGVPCAVCIYDSAGKVVFANDQFTHHFGSAAVAGVFPKRIDSQLQPLEHDERHWLVSSFPVAARNGTSTYGLAAIDVTDRKRLEGELLNAIEAEQLRIGAELHDNLGQQLTGIACLSAALGTRLASINAAASADAQELTRVANEALAQSRAIAHGLIPVQVGPGGLHIALEDLVAQVNRLSVVQCRLHTSGSSPDLHHRVAMHLYRIAQEAIANAVRHGQTRHVTISFESGQSHHRLAVEDDGVGFDIAEAEKRPAGGLRLMKYRASLIGGGLSITARPEGGTRIECRLDNGVKQ